MFFNTRLKYQKSSVRRMEACSRFADGRHQTTQPSPGPWYDTRQCSWWDFSLSPFCSGSLLIAVSPF